MRKSNRAVFILRWLRAPFKVGAVMPSSASLARAMAAQVNLAEDSYLVELGAGTGVVTQALLARGIDPERLIVVERDPSFCKLLERRFPGVRVLNLDANDLQDALEELGIERVSSVISSLPLLSLDRGTHHAVLRQSFDLLGTSGNFVQFTYGPRSPAAADLLAELGVSGQRVARVWRNLPPATVWRYQAGHA